MTFYEFILWLISIVLLYRLMDKGLDTRSKCECEYYE